MKRDAWKRLAAKTRGKGRQGRSRSRGYFGPHDANPRRIAAWRLERWRGGSLCLRPRPRVEVARPARGAARSGLSLQLYYS
jgi:hypothetical protein